MQIILAEFVDLASDCGTVLAASPSRLLELGGMDVCFVVTKDGLGGVPVTVPFGRTAPGAFDLYTSFRRR